MVELEGVRLDADPKPETVRIIDAAGNVLAWEIRQHDKPVCRIPTAQLPPLPEDHEWPEPNFGYGVHPPGGVSSAPIDPPSDPHGMIKKGL